MTTYCYQPPVAAPYPWKKKLNPLWWFQNEDDPLPPAGSTPLRWALRNPLHNFTFYVIGMADRPFTRFGNAPREVFQADWTWAVLFSAWGLPLPFLSYLDRSGRFKFYLGWRERGNFGLKINWT